MTDLPCSAASEEAGEPLAGTAVESVDTWLLLEVNDRWAPKAIETEAFEGAVCARLETWLGGTPRSRLQLIRCPGRTTSRLAFTVVTSANRTASAVELPGYDGLLDLDFGRMLTETKPLERPICLVCVHGQRDRCCARHGSAMFRALSGQEFDLWQTSHLGGHRFAACALWLPDGLMYGRLRPAHADAFVSAHTNAELGDLARFRGRCSHDRPTQAAEIFLLRRLSMAKTDSLSWVSTIATSDASWVVRFRSLGGEHEIEVGHEPLGVLRPASCGKDSEPAARFVELG